IAQPVLVNGGSVSSESNGVKSATQVSSEQQSALSQSSSMTSIQRQESRTLSSKTSIYREDSYGSSSEYHSRAWLTLAKCKLDLKLPRTLTIKPGSSGFEFKVTTFNLDDLVGNINGALVWGAKGFSKSCTSVHLEGTVLVALCNPVAGEPVQSKLDLNEHIIYVNSRRCWEAIEADPDFIDLISSAGWMNVAVITQPDMRGFLTNPAFQSTIKAAAQRAVEEVISEMREEMSLAIEKAVTKVSAMSQEFVEIEMRTLTRKATLTNSAAYSGLGHLKVMSHEQRHAYSLFAPHIGHGPTGYLAALKGMVTGHTAPAPVPEATPSRKANGTPGK
ncbi:hypothetical protein FB451DRAFT_1441467, partial [Mycena latifolia]